MAKLTTHPQNKRAPGEGSLIELPDGRFQLRIFCAYKYGKRVSYNETVSLPRKQASARLRELARLRDEFARGRTPRELKQLLKASRNVPAEELRRRIKADVKLDPEDVLLSTLVEWWLAERKHEVEVSTYEQYKNTSKRLFSFDNLNEQPISELDKERLQKFFDTLANNGQGVERCVYAHILLKQIAKRALAQGKIARNFMDGVTAPTKSRSAKQEQQEAARRDTAISMTPEQVATFLAHVKHRSYFVRFSLAFSSGLRPNEISALKWIDLEPHPSEGWQTLYVRRALGWRKADKPGAQRWYEKAPKTKGSVRKIPLPPELTTLLEEQREIQNRQREAAGKAWQEHGFIFTTSIGAPATGGVTWIVFKRICKRAGLPEHLSLKHPRHTTASLLLANGVPLTTVSQRLGHADPATTLRAYSKSLPSAQADASSLLVGLYASQKIVKQKGTKSATKRNLKNR